MFLTGLIICAFLGCLLYFSIVFLLNTLGGVDEGNPPIKRKRPSYSLNLLLIFFIINILAERA